MMFRVFCSRLVLAAALSGAGASPWAQDRDDNGDGAGQQDRPYQQAQDMRYGAGLYDYFQGNYFDALSTLQVAGHRSELHAHRDNAALIEGGIALAFGLHDRAEILFNEQLQQVDSADNERYRAVAWMKLAELNYLRREWDSSARQLQLSGAADTTDLGLNLALRNGELARAEALLDGRGPVVEALPPAKRILGHLNLAAALARGGRLAEATTHYRLAVALVDGIDEPAEQLLVLRDKAYTGAGYSLTLQEDFAAAMTEFRRVRLHTPWSDRALLGLGWAAIKGGDYNAANDALHFLIQRSPLSPEVQEALVALPYSYEQLARPRAALQSYRHAQQQYQRARDDIARLAQQLDTLALAPAAGAGEAQRYGWLLPAEVPGPVADKRRYLKRLLDSDRFQLRLSELRDLHQLQRVLERWQARLPLFQQLLRARSERRQSILADYRSAQFDQQVDLARERYRQLRAGLEKIERERDALALMQAGATEDDPAVELLALQQRAARLYRQLQASGKVGERERQVLARAHGLLLWQAAQAWHDNLWRQQRALDSVGVALEQAAGNRRQLQQTAERAPQLSSLGARVQSALPRVRSQQRAVNRASAVLEADIRRDLRAELARVDQRLRQYSAHTRLAIARLQDAALQEGTTHEQAPGGREAAPASELAGGAP